MKMASVRACTRLAADSLVYVAALGSVIASLLSLAAHIST